MQTLRRTPLHERHVALGARLVPFAGWEMPVQYEGVIQEHRAVRTDAGVFDVSHMGELEVEGPRAHEFLQGVLSNDLGRVEPGQAQYTLLTNERGGIVDDLIAYRLEPGRYLLIVNASNREADFRWLKERELPGSDVRDISDDYVLLAVQGPRSIERLGLDEAPAFTFSMEELDGVEVMVNRTGYTGEAGVELMVPAEDGPALWDAVLARGVKPAGLGARDTLRLEVCYPLHGNDIGPDTDAISAGLGWVCALDKDFNGAEELRRIKAEGPARRLVAFVMDDVGIPRQGMRIDGEGEVTSGTHSPMLDKGIGMGYVPAGGSEPGTELTIDVRGRPRKAHVVKKPIYKREED
ncbi:MAG TPA: glycine cleavage system aminomethyltransferase GcvT [Gaiellaceae bacterium]|nr:glycine cleavage system aminomethyltransferase GcvT [Gaiellaceae bacterium]